MNIQTGKVPVMSESLHKQPDTPQTCQIIPRLPLGAIVHSEHYIPYRFVCDSSSSSLIQLSVLSLPYKEFNLVLLPQS